jgi:predicted component of type VI protein secretion system
MEGIYVTKIDLEELLAQLVSLYEEGADYIDLEVTLVEDKEADIKVIVKDEYISRIDHDDNIDEDDINDLT